MRIGNHPYEDSDMKVGRYSYSANNIKIHFKNKNSKLFIGNFCSIATDLNVLLAGNHRTDLITTYPFGFINQNVFNTFDGKGTENSDTTKGNVVIGNDVWIGGDVTIMSGVKIGDGCIIAKNSHVVKSTEPYSIYGGNPAKFIRYKFSEEIRNKLLKIKWWDFDDKLLNENLPLLMDNDINKFIYKFYPKLTNYENIVIIPSLIYCNCSYSKDERYEQTKVTIKSVRDRIPNSFIILIDISPFTSDESAYLKNNCDLFINPTDPELSKKIIGKKSYGEKSYLEYVLNLLNTDKEYNYSNFINVRNLFKVGGRYFLNENFDYNKYDNEYDIISVFPSHLYNNACHSSCFKITKSNSNDFLDSLKIFDNSLKVDILDMERMLFNHINRMTNTKDKHYKHKTIDTIGMTCLPSNSTSISYC